VADPARRLVRLATLFYKSEIRISKSETNSKLETRIALGSSVIGISDCTSLLLQHPFAVLSGLVQAEGLGQEDKGGGVVFLAGVDEGRVEPAADVAGVDLEGAQVCGLRLRRPAPLEEGVAQRTPQVGRARRVQTQGQLGQVGAGFGSPRGMGPMPYGLNPIGGEIRIDCKICRSFVCSKAIQ
jgi:hypothetical protein